MSSLTVQLSDSIVINTVLRRLVLVLITLLYLSFSAVLGQTSDQKTLFVDKALKRIAEKMSEQEKQLTDQVEQFRNVEEQANHDLELTIGDRAKAEQKLMDLEERLTERQTSGLYSNPRALRSEIGSVEQQSVSLKRREQTIRAEANKARTAYIRRESELRSVIASNAAVKAELKTLDQTWLPTRTDEVSIRLIAAITTAARTLGLRSSANITSQGSTGKTTGARVRFQGDDERRNNTTPRYSGLTDCKENNLDVGWYYFWTERNNKATSDKDHGKFIIDPVESVQLLEDRYQ